jgi:hypothetical protein
MTATQIMHEITLLPAAERAEVARFARQISEGKALGGNELSDLARRMVQASTADEAQRLKNQIVNGFFGDE